MEFVFKKELSLEEKEGIQKFYSGLDYVTIEQHPFWDTVDTKLNDGQFFFSRHQAQIHSFARIVERKYLFLKFAWISFGPLFKKTDDLRAAVEQIADHYKKRGFFYLFIQLAIPVGNESELLEYQISKKFRVTYRLERANWSSLYIDLGKSADTIFREFSKGHKSAIKKSVAEGVHVRPLENEIDLNEFALLYTKMNRVRQFSKDDALSAQMLLRLNAFFNKFSNGFFLGVFDKEKVMVGGVVIVFQGKTARYFKGASDPERKDISVLHIAIYEAMKIVMERNFEKFDLWGYNHLVSEKDQVFFVNRFKKGFAENFLFYPKPMHFSLTPGGAWLYRVLNRNQRYFQWLLKLVKKNNS
jgi:hypothetical protein